MAKAVALVSALCILALATIASGHPGLFNVEGKIYCDPCRVEFETKLSAPLVGATVRLECRERETQNLTYSVEGVTSDAGFYSLAVEGDHEEDVCEVFGVKSGRDDCNVRFEGYEKARIACTENNGIQGAVRFANAIGFKTQESIPGCKEALDELGFFPL